MENLSHAAKRKIVARLEQLDEEDLYVVDALARALCEAKASHKMEARAGVEPTYTDLQSGA